MSTEIISRGANFENSGIRKLTPPVTRGLEAIFLTNLNAGKAKANFAYNKRDGLIVGTPVVAADYFSGVSLSAFINTRVPETPNMTMLCVARRVSAGTGTTTAPVFSSNWSGSGTGAGAELDVFQGGGEQLRFSVGRSDGAGGVARDITSITTPNIGSFALIHASTGEGVASALSDLTNGISATGSSTAARRLSASPLRLGSAYGALLNGGQGDIALYFHYSEILTTAERDVMADWIRDYMSGRNITV